MKIYENGIYRGGRQRQEPGQIEDYPEITGGAI